jgi:hypothetical protein
MGVFHITYCVKSLEKIMDAAIGQERNELPAVLLSPGGIISKGAQILLEVGLIYLIVTDWLRSSRKNRGQAE